MPNNENRKKSRSPGKKELPLHRLNRTTNTVTKEYRCAKTVCKGCPFHSRCIEEKGTDKRIQVNIFEEVIKKNHEKAGSERHTRVLLLRQIWSEGSFYSIKPIVDNLWVQCYINNTL